MTLLQIQTYTVARFQCANHNRSTNENYLQHGLWAGDPGGDGHVLPTALHLRLLVVLEADPADQVELCFEPVDVCFLAFEN